MVINACVDGVERGLGRDAEKFVVERLRVETLARRLDEPLDPTVDQRLPSCVQFAVRAAKT